MELWVGNPETAGVRRLTSPVLSGAQGNPCKWLYDSRRLVCPFVTGPDGLVPPVPSLAHHPIVVQTDTNSDPSRGSPSSLSAAFEQGLSQRFMTAQLMLVDSVSGDHTPIGTPSIFDAVEPAPGAGFLLIARRVPNASSRSPTRLQKRTEIWDGTGLVRELARAPLRRPERLGGRVTPEPRAFGWRSSAPATLLWVESDAPGDHASGAPRGDRIETLTAPFAGVPRGLFHTEYRFAGVDWLETGFALVHEYDPEHRHRRSWLLNVDDPERTPRLVWDGDLDDPHADPGEPVTIPNRFGRPVVAVHEGCIYLAGESATARGPRPYLDRMHLDSLAAERVWQSPQASYETLVALVSAHGHSIIIRHETPTDPPNFFIRDLRDDSQRELTNFRHPVPELLQARRMPLRYHRADGVELSATLYVPADRKEGERLPLIMWAYPRTYRDTTVTVPHSESLNRFIGPAEAFRRFFVLRGYAVMDDVAMPVVGAPLTANDTFVQQIIENARAAIRKAVDLGIADSRSVGVAGHSYGAFMVANLLAHSDLFKAGVALSGAYNRTLTPFGFQTERRWLWDARDTYVNISPLLYADHIKAPLLLIHGLRDDNNATLPIQSESLYQAIRATGGSSKLVLLPEEGHVYRARESVLDVAAEMLDWFDAYVKNAPAKDKKGLIAQEHPKSNAGS
jgi:dipeptidyl aminopeptidase/acylaminoacyl peptidase